MVKTSCGRHLKWRHFQLSRQPTKKAFRGDDSSLVTAAVSTTSARSPARASMYTKKRVALASPAKFGAGKLADPMVLPSEVRKQEDVRTMEEMVLSMEKYKARQKVKMAPLERVVNEAEQESLAMEAARLVRLKEKEAHFSGIARAKIARELTAQIGHLQAKDDDEDDDATDEDSLDPGGIYSRKSDEDSSFSYHNSEASTADEDEEEFGEGASGCSPLVKGRSEPDEEIDLDSFKWMKEVERRGTFDITDLLDEPINRIFPCVACYDQKNILDRSTWIPAFLRMLSSTMLGIGATDSADLARLPDVALEPQHEPEDAGVHPARRHMRESLRRIQSNDD